MSDMQILGWGLLAWAHARAPAERLFEEAIYYRSSAQGLAGTSCEPIHILIAAISWGTKMKVDAQTLLEALDGRLSASRIASLTAELRALSPAAILTLAQAANITITGDGNIVGDNNVSLVVKGEGATELAAVLRESLYRGRALHQLRQPVSDFVGRDTEIQELMAALRSNQSAAIGCIRGMGGMGKTELALFVADKLRAEYPEAQLFLNMRGTDPTPRAAADALQSCLRALVGLEAKLPDDLDELAQLYRSQLNGKRALILLDNAADSAQVKPLIPPAGCALLVTSRTILALPGSRRIMLDQLQPPEARKFLRSIAPQLTVGEANKIATLCGYLPLALRAAGSLLAVTIDLKSSDYVKELYDERTRLEKIGTEEIDISVEATFNLSYVRLPDEAARVFRALGVVRASFDAKAAEVIAADERHAQLSELVKRSLVHYDSTAKRYRLHDLARLFAKVRLSDKERASAELLHAAHYQKVLAEADNLYAQGHEATAQGLALFELEWSNIAAGQAWAAAQAGRRKTAAQLAVKYPLVGANLLWLRQPPRERIGWLESALASAQCLNQRADEGRIFGNLGLAYDDLGEVRRAITYYKQDLMIARALDDRRGEGQSLGNLGASYYALGKVRRAISFYKQSLTIARELVDLQDESYALGNLGAAHYELGEVRRAINYYEQDLLIARELDDAQGISVTLGNLGLAYSDLGDLQRAIDYHEQHLTIARKLHDHRGEGQALANLGTAYHSLGEVRRAMDFYEQSLAIARALVDRQGEGYNLWNLSLLFEALEERTKAIAYAEDALQILEQIEAPLAATVRQQLAEWKPPESNEGETP